MSGRDLFQPNPETRVAFTGKNRGLSGPHAPRQNRLLGSLPQEDYERLLPDLEPFPLPVGWTVYGPGDRERSLYFITKGIVCRRNVTVSGASAEFAVTGNEGVIGVATFLGGESTPSQAVVVNAGYAYRLAADLARNELEHGRALAHLLLRYTLSLVTQTGQIAVCNRHHSLEKQVCRWILSCMDGLQSNRLTMTHLRIAEMLGVRREGVTQAAGNLQKAGLIRYSRGHITVSDRSRLEAQACECYGVVKRENDRLISQISSIGSSKSHIYF